MEDLRIVWVKRWRVASLAVLFEWDFWRSRYYRSRKAFHWSCCSSRYFERDFASATHYDRYYYCGDDDAAAAAAAEAGC